MTSRQASSTADRQKAERSRHIFILANNIDELGGLQRVVHNLAQLFALQGHQVELIGISHAAPAVSYTQAPLYRSDVLYDVMEPKPWRPKRLRDLLDVRSWRRERRRRAMRRSAVDKLAKKFHAVPDGIVIVSQVYAMEWVHAARPRHLRIIGQSHESYEASRGYTRATRGSTRYRRIMTYFRDIDAFLVLTMADAEKFEQDGLNNVGVMHNPLTFYPERSAELRNKTVVSLGRYDPQKNHLALLDAFVLVAPRHPEWQLRIYGSGPLEAELRDHVEAVGLIDRAHIMGPTDRAIDVLLDSSIFALSSDYEGLPLTLCEAMACGVPCVSFDCAPGIAEIIRDGEDGLIVPPHDVPALAEGICRLIEDDELRAELGRRARENIRRFSAPAIVRQWHELFDVVER
jgi:glycosyltransferase involved in cell wall biosynthesis